MELEDSDDLAQEFLGGKLQLNADEIKSPNANLENKLIDTADNINNNDKNRWENSLISPIVSLPQRIIESMWYKKSSGEEDKSNSLKLAVPTPGGNASDFFTFRQSIIEHAVKECVEQFIDEETDGPLCSAYLLTEISLWDTEKERLLLVTSKSLVTVKYDFIALRRLEYKKLSLKCIDTVIIGDIVYPSTSIIPHLNGFADGILNIQNCLFDALSKNKTKSDVPNYFNSRNRNMRGIRLMWNNGKPLNFGNKWNPLNNDVPFVTFTAHPLWFHKDCTNNEQTKVYDVEEFVECICSILTNLKRNLNESSIIIHHKNIIMENYIGIGSLIHNRNALGFLKFVDVLAFKISLYVIVFLCKSFRIIL